MTRKLTTSEVAARSFALIRSGVAGRSKRSKSNPEKLKSPFQQKSSTKEKRKCAREMRYENRREG